MDGHPVSWRHRMTFETILVRLTRARVRYIVVGGVGVVHSGHPRLTADLDLIPDLSDGNLRRCIRALRRLGYRPRLPVPAEALLDPRTRKEWYEKKNLRAFTFVCERSPLEDVDLLIYPESGFARAWKRRRMIALGSARVPVASVEDLIRMKGRAWRESGRPKDLEDLEALKAIQRRTRKR